MLYFRPKAKSINVYPVFKKEISAYLSSLVAYITIGVFLLVMGLFLWVFPESSILEYGYAGLDNLFATAPYLFMFLIPAITMRSLAEERREGTFELLLTRPLTHLQIVIGKYLACLLLVLFALLPTLIYYFSVYQLGAPQGNIDTGAVIGSYIGLFLLGGVFVAIGLFASSISKNQIIAFTIAVFLCYFFYSGFDSLGGLLSLQNTEIQNFGINEHYQSVSRGVLDTRDLFYFIILTAIFIGLTLLVLVRQQQKRLQMGVVLGSVAIIAVIWFLTDRVFTRFDFTTEKRFTLSAVSRNVMDSLAAPVRVTVYLQGDNFPGGFKRLQRATRDILMDLQSYSHDKLQFDFFDPLEGLNADQQNATINAFDSLGLVNNLSVKTENGLTQKIVFPAAMVSGRGKQIPVKLLQTRIGLSDEDQLNNSVQNLEYAFTSAIKKAASGGMPRIGFTEGHNEQSNLQLNDALKSLSDGYLVGRVDVKNIPQDSLQTMSLLVIPKPDMPFTEAEKFKIDQYLMHGGRIVWAIDQVSAELDSLRGKGGDQLAFPKKLNLDDQLFTYGIRLNYDLLADMNCSRIPVAAGSMGGQAQIQLAPWLFYPVFIPMSTHPVVKNVEGISSRFAGSIDTLGIRNLKKTVLLTTSPYAKRFDAPYMLSLQALEQEPNPKEFYSKPKITGVLLEGSFVSDFRNRPVPEGVEGHPQVAGQSKPTKMMFFSDGDLFSNQVATDGSPYPLGFDQYTRQTYGNKTLLLNIADYMTDDSGLIALRSKEIKLRLLDRARLRTEKVYWQIINMALPLAMVLIFAIFQHYVRRYRYAR